MSLVEGRSAIRGDFQGGNRTGSAKQVRTHAFLEASPSAQQDANQMFSLLESDVSSGTSRATAVLVRLLGLVVRPVRFGVEGVTGLERIRTDAAGQADFFVVGTDA